MPDSPGRPNDQNEKQNITHVDGFNAVQDQAFALLEKSLHGEKLSKGDVNTVIGDFKKMDAGQYSDVVVAAFGGRKEQYVALPTELKDSFKEWIDFFKAQNTHPASVAMNENILKAVAS
jgi:hypothetical protein